MSTPTQRLNEQIAVPQVRLIGEDGEPLGVQTTQQALKLAQDRGLDLVEVAPDAAPPVCKLMDFGKQKYRQKKRQHDAKKKQHSVEVKELWFRPSIDPHDLNIKLDHAKSFLEHGFKVTLTMRFRGREKTHKEYGMHVLDEIGTALKDFGRIEQESRSERNRVQIVLSPLKTKKAHAKSEKKPEGAADAEAENTQG